MPTTKQLAANRANSRKSTGPCTEQGKLKSRLNASRHSLTGQVLILADEDREAYQAHCRTFTEHYQPQSEMEHLSVQQLADIRWRMNRITAIESNLFALTGYRSNFDTGIEQADRALGQAEAMEFQVRSLATLSIYEQRLQRQFMKAEEHFEKLQRRRLNDESRAQRAAELQAAAQPQPEPPAATTPEPAPQAEENKPAPGEIGFVYSSGSIARELANLPKRPPTSADSSSDPAV